MRVLKIYATTHTSVFPLLLSSNITTFASGFTQTAFFCFYPTHLLQQKQSIAGPKFLAENSDDARARYEIKLKQKGFTLRYTHIGTNTDPSDGCTRYRRRVDDLAGTTVFAWSTEETDRIQNSMLNTLYTWVNGAECIAPCCVTR